MNRKALLIGIDEYPEPYKLHCCVNDVNVLSDLLEENYDGRANFSIEKLLNKDATRAKMRSSIKELFSGEGDLALLYFSGHGCDNDKDGFVVSSNFENEDFGISMEEIAKYAANSKYRNKIIILDCCHSGFIGNFGLIGDITFLKQGTILMTACKEQENAIEINEHGVFTNLLIEALRGGAADILGDITPGGVYAFIDRALGPWNQRPLFKASISSFVSLRKVAPKIELVDLKKVMNLFDNNDFEYPLNPSYEKTNYEGSKHLNYEPYSDSANVKIFELLQICNRNNLLLPIGENDMYFAAMNSKGCKLTPLGKHYWHLVKDKLI